MFSPIGAPILRSMSIEWASGSFEGRSTRKKEAAILVNRNW